MLDFKTLVGMSEEAAETSLKAEEMLYRIRKKDGQEMSLSMDYRDDRVNLDVENGKVVAAALG